jgi:hypothetical protein
MPIALNNVVCTEYENLLFSCKDALDVFRMRREELGHYGQNNQEAIMTLVRLRTAYQRAYSKLIRHFDACELCQHGTNKTESRAVIPFSSRTA